MKTNVKLIFLCGCFWCCRISFAQTGNGLAHGKRSGDQKSVASLHRSLSSFRSLLQTWCDGLLSLQVKGGPDDGGIFSPSHGFVNGRCGDAVYPFLAVYDLTGNDKYRTAAIRVFNWSEAHVSQPDGSWVNETGGKNNWKGITVFSTIALGEALRHHGSSLPAAEREQWRQRLRRGGDYLLDSFTFETGDINYPNSAAAALAVCWKVLGDEKYRVRAKEFAAFAGQHFTKNNLIWGEGVRGAADTSAKGLRPIDLPYNVEESLANLALYADITGDKNLLNAVAKSLQSHLLWMLPDGALDAGWCARQYKWTYYGSATTDGPASGFALLAKYDRRFAEAAFRSLGLRQSDTHKGLLYGGRDLFSRNVPVFAHHTFSNAKGLAAALDAGLTTSPKVALPNDSAYGLREWPEAGVVQIGIGPWRASVTANDIASSSKRGGHPMGGALTMLWHRQSGPLAVAGMNDYKLYEATNMRPAKNESEEACLTPRLEMTLKGKRYSTIYDSKARMAWSKKAGVIEVKINGDLRDKDGDPLPGGRSSFEIRYRFGPRFFQMAAHADAGEAKLLFPLVSAASEPVKHTAKGEVLIQKGAATITLTSAQTATWQSIGAGRLFSYVPGFEAVAVANTLDENGNCSIKIEVGK